MKRSGKTALSGLLMALSTVSLLLTVFQSAAYALPALAGVLLLPATLECGYKWGFAVYGMTAVLAALITPSVEAKLLFIAFFGYYPTLKLVLEQIKHRALVWGLKLLCFNAAMIGTYALLIHVFSFPTEEFVLFGVNVMWGFLAVGNVILVIFDIAVTGLVRLYFRRFHPFVTRIFH